MMDGLLVEVTEVTRGSQCLASIVGGTSLPVEDITDFPEDGGIIDILGVRVTYTAATADPPTVDASGDVVSSGVLTLATATTVDEYDPVLLVVGDDVATVATAIVDIPAGDDSTTPDGGDLPHVPLSITQRAVLQVGVYDPPLPVILADDLSAIVEVPDVRPTLDLSPVQDQIDNLNDVTIPALQTDLATAQSDIDAAQADISTLDGKFPIAGTDIQDGAISTPKMTANSINGDRITANTLDAAKIVAGSITTDRMTANSINGDRITTNTLNADRIVANSITGDRIAANAITAGLIAAGAVTASKLESALVLSTRIIAGSATGARVEVNSSGMVAYNSTGTQTIAFDAATGNATITGAFGTSGPTAAGVHISSNTFSGIYGQATYPQIEFHNGNNTAGQRRPLIFTDTTGNSNLYLWGGAASTTRMGLVKLDSGRARIGLEKTAGSNEADGTVLDMGSNYVSLITDTVYHSSAWRAKVTFDSVATFIGYEAPASGWLRGFQILAGDGSARILCDASLSVLSGDGSSYQTFVAEKITSTANGIWMVDLNGGGSTGANIGNGGRIVRATSSLRYKDNIEPLPLDVARKALDLAPVTYTRKDEADLETPIVYPGFIAEQADEVGASLWVNYDTEGRPDGFRYAELTAALVPIIRDLINRVITLETKETPA